MADTSPPSPSRAAWSADEVDLIVADYFDMLRLEMLGQPYSKAEHRHALASRLARRSDPSIEFKHANISAVLLGMGLPYIDGYKPRGNYQGLLEQAVEEFLGRQSGLVEQLAQSPRLSPDGVPQGALAGEASLFEHPPERIIVPSAPTGPWRTRRGCFIDFALRDAQNRHLGKLGEQFVVQVEKGRLLQARRDDLAKKVEWVAQTQGDGLGFDVLSFNEQDDRERYVEVKTTGLGKFFPFYVTATEVRCSEGLAGQYHLYRVFDFSRSPRLYTLNGSLAKVCRLEPVQYRASI